MRNRYDMSERDDSLRHVMRAILGAGRIGFHLVAHLHQLGSKMGDVGIHASWVTKVIWRDKSYFHTVTPPLAGA